MLDTFEQQRIKARIADLKSKVFDFESAINEEVEKKLNSVSGEHYTRRIIEWIPFHVAMPKAFTCAIFAGRNNIFRTGWSRGNGLWRLGPEILLDSEFFNEYTHWCYIKGPI